MITAKNNPAFPLQCDHMNSPINGGLTKLEWFAGMALRGWFANSNDTDTGLAPGQTLKDYAAIQVRYFYDYAEAMLAESEKRR